MSSRWRWQCCNVTVSTSSVCGGEFLVAWASRLGLLEFRILEIDSHGLYRIRDPKKYILIEAQVVGFCLHQALALGLQQIPPLCPGRVAQGLCIFDRRIQSRRRVPCHRGGTAGDVPPEGRPSQRYAIQVSCRRWSSLSTLPGYRLITGRSRRSSH